MTEFEVFDRDTRQELITGARRLAEQAGIMSDALHARFEHEVANRLLESWWRMMVSAATLPDFSALTKLLSDDDA